MTNMARSHLRLYQGPERKTCATLTQASNGGHCVTVSVGDVLPLLADAVRSERTWLRDFEDDQITVSTDLYEVLLAYQHFRRPSA
jgi:hypothetical protein